MRWIGCAMIVLGLAAATAEAGGLRRRNSREDAVPPAPSTRMVTPNGVVVPDWAARQLAASTGPLQGKSWGRRPWAMPLNQSTDTPAAYWARLDQLGYGAGPTPGYTNGPGIGNFPSAPIGPDGGPLARRGFRLPIAPYNPSSLTFD